MAYRIRLPRNVGRVFLAVFVIYGAYWASISVGFTGELRPQSNSEVGFRFIMVGGFHNTGYTWAHEGDTIVVDYDVKLDAGFFSLSVGKKQWPYKRLLRDEQVKSLRKTAAGQILYPVKHTGVHVIWAGKYSAWRGDARVRWSVRSAPEGSRSSLQ